MAAFAFARTLDLLTHDIIQKCESVKESNATTRKKKRWCEVLEQNIERIYPNRKLILVGSSTTSFAIEGCDVDLTIIRTDSPPFYGFESGLQILSRIRDALIARTSINTEVKFSVDQICIFWGTCMYIRSLIIIFQLSAMSCIVLSCL